jgi:hypothetical protein
MFGTKMLVRLCIAFLLVFTVVFVGSSKHPVPGFQSCSPSADHSTGVKVLRADGTEPQPAPMPLPAPWHKLAA